MFNAEEMEMIATAAMRIGVTTNHLLAFMLTETNGQSFANVNGRPEPLIRFEGHYFYKLLPPELRDDAMRQGLADKKVGGVKNPKSQEARYGILARAKKIHMNAAIMSCSWGIGQVMGSHWEWLEYNSPIGFEKAVRSGFFGQLDAMVKFLEKSNIVPHLKRGDWTAVARIYNGPAYAKNNYHVKMKEHYAKLVGLSNDWQQIPKSAGMLRSGSKGAAVRELQSLLKRAGFSLNVDGDFGAATERAVKVWQKNHGLEVDGVAGPATMRSLERLKVSPDEQLGIQPTLENNEVKGGLITGVGGAAVIETAKSGLDSAVMNIAGLAGTPAVDYILTGLSVCSAALAVGGLAYAAYGWYKKDRTFRGTEEMA